MTLSKGFLLLWTSVCLSISMLAGNAAVANDKKPGNSSSVSDLSRLAGEASPAAKRELSDLDYMTGKLRTSESPAKVDTGKAGVNKSEMAKTMIGKFRINGI